jgi:hypothetical protein
MVAWKRGDFKKVRLPICCDIPGCHELAKTKGMCKRHYSNISQTHRLHTDPGFKAYRLKYVLRSTAENPERHAEHITRSKRITHWARWLATSCKHSAKRHGCAFDVDGDYFLALWESQNGRCYWLGIPLEPSIESRNPSRPSADRLIPELGYVKGNVVLTTQFANMGRNACPADKFAEFVKTLRR